MSKRTLPAAPNTAHRTIGNRGTVQSDAAPPEAFDRWDATIRAAAADDNVVSIMGVIGEDFFGNTNNTVRRISAALRSIGPKDVTVHIHSPGGDFFEGLAIYNQLREHKGEVTVKILGLAASAAAIIAMAGDKVLMPKAGFMMIHNTQAVTIGDQHDHQQTVDLLKPFDDAIGEIFAARTGIAPKAVAKMLDEGTWIAGDVAIEKGFADGLLPADEAIADPKAKNEAAPVVAVHKLDAILARATDMSRADRRKFMKEVRGGMPSAAATGTPGAADQESSLADVLAALKSVTIA